MVMQDIKRNLKEDAKDNFMLQTSKNTQSRKLTNWLYRSNHRGKLTRRTRNSGKHCRRKLEI